MANHVEVRTLQRMTPKSIQAVLDSLNKTHFKGLLTFQAGPSDTPGDKAYFWEIFASGQHLRQCWLDSPRHFEMRHGGGSAFAWWVDTLIVHTIAATFEGKTRDEGTDDRYLAPHPEKYQSFSKYLTLLHGRSNFLNRAMILHFERGRTPKGFKGEVRFVELAEDEKD